MLFDTHTHIYLSKEKTELEVIRSIEADQDLSHIVTIGTDLVTSQHNLELTQEFPFILAAISIHPCYVQQYIGKLDESMWVLESMIQSTNRYCWIPLPMGEARWGHKDQVWNKVVAVGEIGLDYYRLPPRLTTCPPELDLGSLKALQKSFFIAQIRLAKKYNLPIIIHDREAKEDVFEILKSEDCKNFVFHCYSEDLEYAKRLLEFSPDCMISFSGTVTFKSAPNLQETAKNIPLKNILIETDCPYLAPVPERGTENYPSKVKYVLKKIQDLRTESPQEIEDTIYQNSLRFFSTQ
jgi:TatD DNase family protein